MKRTDVELLSPAGDFETALAAFAAGADAIYCGLPEFSARAFAKNFSYEDLANIVAVARKDAKKVYVTFNTLLDEDQVEGAVETLAKLEEIGPDGVIVQDLGVARLVRKFFPALELHASTQLVAHNLEGVLALKELGFRRVVLARELSLAEVTSIAQRCGARKIADDGRPELELEVFIHGALCYSLSGLCLFGAMEKGRSGNRGQCPYCCRVKRTVNGEQRTDAAAEASCYPFSMKDLRLGEEARRLADAGVSSLKIEGRMKSALYVASVTRYYRDILDGATPRVTPADLETVFSRRTTKLYFDGRTKGGESPIDAESLGHLGAPVGTVKKVTRDRDGLAWLRFHTARALEKHDGLQFEATDADGRHLGLGIAEMRQAISRRLVFEVNAGVDVEILLPEETGLAEQLKPGMKIYCSMSNAVRRMFPAPSFRPSDYEGGCAIDVRVVLKRDKIEAFASRGGDARDVRVARDERVPPSWPHVPDDPDAPRVAAAIDAALTPAKAPEKTEAAVRKAFSKLGGTGYRLGSLVVEDPEKLFAPASLLNDLRRELVEKLDDARAKARREKIEAAVDGTTALPSVGLALRASRDGASVGLAPRANCNGASVKIRVGQTVPPGDWREIVVAINAETEEEEIRAIAPHQPPVSDDPDAPHVADDPDAPRVAPTVGPSEGLANHGGDKSDVSDVSVVRLALPVFTPEPDFNRLRSAVKRLVRAGYAKWECADLATLRLLKAVGVTDITADWTLAAFNANALATLAELGVSRVVASPENNRDNLQYLAESGSAVEFLSQQSTPLFISLTQPAPYESDDLVTFRRDGLWITTKRTPRTFAVPDGAATRLDLSWDFEDAE